MSDGDPGTVTVPDPFVRTLELEVIAASKRH